jgi:hypothetical protein
MMRYVLVVNEYSVVNANVVVPEKRGANGAMILVFFFGERRAD